FAKCSRRWALRTSMTKLARSQLKTLPARRVAGVVAKLGLVPRVGVRFEPEASVEFRRVLARVRRGWTYHVYYAIESRRLLILAIVPSRARLTVDDLNPL